MLTLLYPDLSVKMFGFTQTKWDKKFKSQSSLLSV